MFIDDQVLQNNERIIFELRSLFAKRGFSRFAMSKFEEYDTYAGNKDFLVSDNVITFTDTNGKLMALKPDVTLSVVKSSRDIPQETKKLFYSENVYRVSKGTGSFKEIMQTGVECIGNVSCEEICSVLELAAESLSLISPSAVLNISSLDILNSLIANLDDNLKRDIYDAIAEKNLNLISRLAEAGKLEKKNADALIALLAINDGLAEAAEKLQQAAAGAANEMSLIYFKEIITRLSKSEFAGIMRVNFSVTGDINYYNGVLFKGYVRGIPEAVLSGGQYDRLMQKLGRKSKAIGFAVYTDRLDDMSDVKDVSEEDDEYINIALPKGRLGEKVYAMLEKAGYPCPELLDPKRKLVFENSEKKVRYFWVKPSDSAIYVERGAADVGIAGKDILLEQDPDVYELVDLGVGICKMAIAGPKGFEKKEGTLKVATKFPEIAKSYYAQKGRDIDIIKLNGSIEIAPILGLSDVICDIVETGKTLAENDLVVLEDVAPVSARFIANKSSYNFKAKQIAAMAESLKAVLGEYK